MLDKGSTRSLQSGADAALREVRANRNTTTGRAMVRQTDEGESAALQSMSLKLQQKTSKADLFALWDFIKKNKKICCASANNGEEGVSPNSDAPVKVF